MTFEPVAQWLTVADARQQAHDYVLGFLPEEPDEVDCETCRTIKQIAAGLKGAPDDGGDQPETSGD